MSPHFLCGLETQSPKRSAYWLRSSRSFSRSIANDHACGDYSRNLKAEAGTLLPSLAGSLNNGFLRELRSGRLLMRSRRIGGERNVPWPIRSKAMAVLPIYFLAAVVEIAGCLAL